MKDEKEATSGATNTESGHTKETEPSVPDFAEEVKMAQMAGIPFCSPKIKVSHPLDVRTEMFMLDALRESLDAHLVADSYKWNVISSVIASCTEANGI